MSGKQCSSWSDAAFCGVRSDLHCLSRPVCPTTYGIYGNYNNDYFLKRLLKPVKLVQMCQQLSTCIIFSALGKIFSRRHFEFFFLILPRKQVLIFHANCLLRRQFAWTVKAHFLDMTDISNLSSAELAKRVVKVKQNIEGIPLWVLHTCSYKIVLSPLWLASQNSSIFEHTEGFWCKGKLTVSQTFSSL